MEVSVIIPMYNATKFIVSLLNDLKNQKFKDVEFLLINDGSTDSTEEKVNSWLSNNDDSRFKYFYKKNSGVSETRNYGISMSTGKYIIFVDSDDRVESNFIAEYYSRIHSDNLDICFFSVNKINSSGDVIGKLDYKYLADGNSDGIKALEMFEMIGRLRLYGYPFMYISKRELWDEKAFPDNIDYQEDLEALARMISRNPWIVGKAFDTSFYNYVQRENSALHTMTNIDTLQFLVVAKKVKEYLQNAGGGKKREKIINGIKLSSALAVANSSLLANDKENYEFGRRVFIDTFKETEIIDFSVRFRRRIQYYMLLFRLSSVNKMLYAKLYNQKVK